MRTILFLMGILLFACEANDHTTIEKNVVTWDYPVKPGTEAWKKFNSNEEMVNACQIPEKILSALSTENLTKLCLQYPLLHDVFAFNSINDGLDKLFDDFNGIRELYKRKDVSENLVKRYAEKLQNFPFWDGSASDLEKGRFIVSISILEVLLSRIEQGHGGKDTQKNILRHFVSGYEDKLKYADYFMELGFRTSFYSRIHVILKIDPSSIERLPQKDKNSVLFSGIADEQSIRIIDDLSYQLIK
jgi:hypothetical protein